MSEKNGSETVNTGGAPKQTAEERNRDFEIAGNAEVKGEKPSPSDRERGETASADPVTAVDPGQR